ncbi:ATP-binding protein, partial [Streptococcus suis]
VCATLIDDVEDRDLPGRYDGPNHCEVRVRPVAFKRALSNLVENALHYAGNVVLRLDSKSEGVTIAVEDDGPGIPDEQLKRVLEPFVRLDTAR